jgi:hypothetical protein
LRARPPFQRQESRPKKDRKLIHRSRRVLEGTELCPVYDRKSIEMTLCVIKQNGLSFPPSILRENDFVQRLNPWRKDSAAGYPVIAHLYQEIFLEFLSS